MIIKTVFRHDEKYELGEVEVKLLPGIPQLHVVGLPDSHIRECGVKLKSAIKSSGLKWPQGHQIVVNLRPSYFRKTSSGADLAIVLGFLSATGQLREDLREKLEGSRVYGEVTLDGRVFAPRDFERALRAAGEAPILTGQNVEALCEGEWWAVENLSGLDRLEKLSRRLNWRERWSRPELPDFRFHPKAAEALALAAHGEFNVLVAGPQGTGKSTWAQTLYALTAEPDLEKIAELRELFGDEVMQNPWRPFERPHHSITPLAMVGGGAPLMPGVISRAHGGVLVMDEFLEFHQSVLEALREPVETGHIEHARRGERTRFHADFQLIATTNLCLCGKLAPKISRECSYSLLRCRSVIQRLSGPVLDRFDLLLYSHEWLAPEELVPAVEIRERVEAARRFAKLRADGAPPALPEWMQNLRWSHRRQHAVLRVARALADFAESSKVEPTHIQRASEWVTDPMAELNQIFG